MATALEILPRAPLVVNQRSGTFDAPTSYRESVLRWREAARGEAILTLRMNPEWENIRKYIDYLEGSWWDRKRPRYRSGFFVNRLAQTRIDTLSLLTDIRPAVEVDTDIAEYRQQAEIAQKIIYYEWANMNLDLELIRAVDHAMFGVGYWKLGASLPGMMSVLPLGMDTVLPIQPGNQIQESHAVLYRTYKPLHWFYQKFGEDAKGLEREAASPIWTSINADYPRPGLYDEYTWNSLSPAMRYHLGARAMKRSATKSGSFPVIEFEEYWIDDPSVNEYPGEVLVKDPRLSIEEHNYHYVVKQGQRLFPRKRLIVFAGNRIMYDGPSPYWHGLFPFVQMSLNPITWAPGGLSKYRNLVPLNWAMNHVGAGVLDIVNRAVEPQLVAKEGAVADDVWRQFYSDMPGGKLRMSMLGNPMTDVRYLDPPPLPAYVQMFNTEVRQEYDRLAGTVDVASLGRKKQVPGGDTIEQMRDTMQTGFRLESRYLEPFLRDAGIQAVSHAFQFYTRGRRMRLLGPRGMTMDDFDYNPGMMVPWTVPREDHWKLFALRIAQGSLHGAARDREKQVAISLFRLNGISRREMLRRLDWAGDDRIEQIEKEIAEERMAGVVPDATGKGEVPRLTRGARTGNPY